MRGQKKVIIKARREENKRCSIRPIKSGEGISTVDDGKIELYYYYYLGAGFIKTGSEE